MIRRLRTFVLPFFALTTLSLAALSAPAMAQLSQQDIDANLCSGSSIDFSGASGNDCNNTNATNTVSNLIKSVINLLSLVVGTVAVIMIIVGGLRYITSGGNDASVTGAKNTLLYAVVGLAIVALAQVIVHFILSKIAAAS